MEALVMKIIAIILLGFAGALSFLALLSPMDFAIGSRIVEMEAAGKWPWAGSVISAIAACLLLMRSHRSRHG